MGAQAEGTDADLLAHAQQGGVEAFARLYERHAGAVLRYCWARTGTREAGEDLTQDAFVVAWSKRRSATIVDDSLLPWLLTISRNLIANHLRRAARRQHEELRDTDGAAASEDLDLALWIQTELARLSPIDQELCRLCLVDGLSYRDAAAALGTSEAAVGKRLQRLRARLRATFATDSSDTSPTSATSATEKAS